MKPMIKGFATTLPAIVGSKVKAISVPVPVKFAVPSFEETGKLLQALVIEEKPPEPS